MHGNYCRHQETKQIPQETETTEVHNEILNSLAAHAFMDFYGIAEREADGTVEESLTRSTSSPSDFEQVDNVYDTESQELMAETDVPGGGGIVQRSAKYLKYRDFRRAKQKRKRQQQDGNNSIEEASENKFRSNRDTIMD